MDIILPPGFFFLPPENQASILRGYRPTKEEMRAFLPEDFPLDEAWDDPNDLIGRAAKNSYPTD
jgi:hypothetical protein